VLPPVVVTTVPSELSFIVVEDVSEASSSMLALEAVTLSL